VFTSLYNNLFKETAEIGTGMAGKSSWEWDQGPDSERHSISERTVNTGALLIAQIHGYLLGLKSIKTLIVGLQKFKFTCNNFYNINY
jgi:hypothetical protein